MAELDKKYLDLSGLSEYWKRTKKYIDNVDSKFNSYLPLTGGTITGDLIVSNGLTINRGHAYFCGIKSASDPEASDGVFTNGKTTPNLIFQPYKDDTDYWKMIGHIPAGKTRNDFGIYFQHNGHNRLWFDNDFLNIAQTINANQGFSKSIVITNSDGSIAKYNGSSAATLNIIDQQNVTYSKLVTLRNNKKLVSGRKYRITDYETKTNQSGTNSAGHPFDIIVEALNENTLSENAKACIGLYDFGNKHSDGDLFNFNIPLTGTNGWTTVTENNIPTKIKENLPVHRNGQNTANDVRCQQGTRTLQAGILKVTFTWNSGGAALHPVGVEVISNNSVIASDYHAGVAGSPTNTKNNIYVLNIPNNVSNAIIKFYIECNSEELNSLCSVKAENYDNISYYQNSKISAWDIKYRLDNDTRFNWVNSNCKGVIYYMKDEYNNEASYDFKNIKYDNYYTFDYAINGVHYDGSVKYGQYCYDNKVTVDLNETQQNLPKIYFKNTSSSSLCHSNVFSNNVWQITFGDSCYENIIGGGSESNTFGDSCCKNTLGRYCKNNRFDDTCIKNLLKDDCISNEFGLECSNNVLSCNCGFNIFDFNCKSNNLGYNCSNNLFSVSCSHNKLGDYCEDNEFGCKDVDNNFVFDSQTGVCQHNKLGNECTFNKFGEKCSYNILGAQNATNKFKNSSQANVLNDQCSFNEFGAGCYNNTLLQHCTSNIFGEQCSYNYFFQYCTSNRFGNFCQSNTFEQYCTSNTFGNYFLRCQLGKKCQSCSVINSNSEALDYIKMIEFPDECNNCQLQYSGSTNTSPTLYLCRYRIMLPLSGAIPIKDGSGVSRLGRSFYTLIFNETDQIIDKPTTNTEIDNLFK